MDRCLLLFVVGTAISLYLPTHGTSLWAIVACGFALLIALTVTHLRLVASTLVALFCGIALATANLNWQLSQTHALKSVQQPINVVVKITEQPHHDVYSSRFTAKLISINGKPSYYQPLLNLTWYDQQARMLQQAQQWQLLVSIKSFRNYWNEGSRDYIASMRRHGIVARGTVKQGRLLHVGADVRARLARRFSQLTTLAGREQSAIIAALSIGIRDFMTAEQRQLWQTLGLSHALAISGLHLSLVGWAGFAVGRKLIAQLMGYGCRPAILERYDVLSLSWLLAVGVALAYAWLAGFSIATLRALLMLVILVLHRLLALAISPWQLLLRTVAVLLAIDPLALLDVGFWLSVTALLTIFTTLWRWQSGPAVSKAYQLLRLQLMFLVVMAPLSLHWFGGLSLVAPVINLFGLPVISFWVLPFSLLGTLAELCYAYQFADNLWFLAELPLLWLSPALTAIADWSWSWWQPAISIPTMVLLLVLLLVLMPIKQPCLKTVLLITIPLALTALYYSRERDSKVYLHVLDVGQSQAVLIERNGRAWLVDTGISYGSGYSLAATVIQPFLQQRQLHLEGGWVSHADKDHSGGLAFLRRAYPHAQWYGALTEQPCEQGMQSRWNDIKWQVHWPPRQHTIRKSNNQSCVLSFQFGQFSFLIPGDIEFSSEREIAETQGFPRVDILVAPHHGSKTSSGWLMLKQTSPSLILLSNGKHKGFDFPHRYTTARYQHMQRSWFNTKDVGQLTVVSDGESWQLLQPLDTKRRRRLYQTDD